MRRSWQSLARYWRGRAIEEPIYSELGRGLRIAPHYPNARNDLWSVYDSALHYIASSSGAEELYRLSVDPLEEHDVAGSPRAAAKELPYLRELLVRHRAGIGRNGAPARQ